MGGFSTVTVKPTDTNLTLNDVTTNNASAIKHGFLSKLPNDANKNLNGVGKWVNSPTFPTKYGVSSYPRTDSGEYSTDITDAVIDYMNTKHLTCYRMSISPLADETTRNAMISYYLENCPYDLVVCRHVYNPGGSYSEADWTNVLAWVLEVCEAFSAYAGRVAVEFVNECGDSDLGTRCQAIVTAVRNAGYTNNLVANKWTQNWSSMIVTDPLGKFYSGMHFYFNTWSVSGAQTQMQYAQAAGIKVFNTEVGADSSEETQFDASEVTEVNEFLAWCQNQPYIYGCDVWMRYGLQNADTYDSLGLKYPLHTSISDANIVLSDVTTNNASTVRHGFLPKLPASTGKYLKDDLTWDTPAGGSSAPTKAKFTVTNNGATINVYNSSDELVYTGTAFGNIVNTQVFANLTAGRTYVEKVLLMGNFTLETKLLVPAFTEVELIGKVTRSASYLNSMLEYATTDARDISIHGGVWDGGGTAYDGFVLTSTYTDGKNVHQSLHDLTFSRIDAICINATNMNVSTIDSIRVEGYPVGTFLRLSYSTDCTISNVVAATVGSLGGIVCDEGSGTNHFSNIYIGGGRYGITIIGNDNNTFAGCTIHDCTRHGLWLKDDSSGNYCRYNSWTGGTIYNNGADENNTYDNVFIDGHSHHNTIMNAHLYSVVTNKPRYNWNENTVDCNWNVVAYCTCTNAVTAQTHKQGTNSINTPILS